MMANFRLLNGETVKGNDSPTRKQINADITRGAKWIESMLGENWERFIDTDTLDSNSVNDDILGQLAHLLCPDEDVPDYFDVVYNYSGTEANLAWSLRHGFTPWIGSDSGNGFAILTDGWLRHIDKWRKANGMQNAEDSRGVRQYGEGERYVLS